MAFADVFNDDAFSNISLTAAVNEIDHVPGQAGALAFLPTGASHGVPTTSVAIEKKSEELKLIQTTPRGAPSEKEVSDKRTMRKFTIPHIQLEDTIYPASIQDVRAFGTEGELQSVESVVNERLAKINSRFDLTLENMRLGAIKGLITDADGSVLFNLFEEFQILNSNGQEAPETFDFNLDSGSSGEEAVRITCHAIGRFMKRNLKMLSTGHTIWALCGDNFFDKLVENPSVKGAYDGYAAAAQRLGDSYIDGVFEFGGIYFVNYQGTDDAATVTIETEEARFFLSGVPGLFTEPFAPADTIDATNGIGLPRYAAIAVDPEFQRYAKLRVESNPLPLCVRPKTLCKGISGAESE